MKLTRGERARTTLLLRCAADVAVTGDHVLGPGWSTAPRLGLGKRVCDLATRAASHVAREIGRDPDVADDLDDYVAVVLEAALRVEDGSWPA